MQNPQGEEKRGSAQTLGWFALVAYIPEPFARFLDELRLDLSPECNPRAHVTVLPPRPHHTSLKETTARLRDIVGRFPPFIAEAGQVTIFDVSNVVYLDLARGGAELSRMYKTLNCGSLAYREDFEFHPHITLAQQVSRSEAVRLAAEAQPRWAAYSGPRDFLISSFSFVQHVAPSIWADVATISLGEGSTKAEFSEADASEPSPVHSAEAFQPR